jgi:hypothetical protein
LDILSYAWQNLSNAPGRWIKRKIVVIESDDWGSIRMPSLKSFERLEKLGLNLRSADAERYNLNDSLATSHDLECLFEVLSSIKDINGNNAVFTPVCIVANPDFQRIKDSGYDKYYYEPFTTTLKRYPGCEKSFDLWKEGIEKKLFVPQMHGREHLNVTAWMCDLKRGETNTLLAFEEEMWGFVPTNYPLVDYQAAFQLANPTELDYHRNVIQEGLQLFNELFGYKPEYFVPPNGPFNNSLNSTLIENNIKYRCASKIQNETLGLNKTRRVLHYLGQKDRYGIRYITRNCFFEPSQPGKDWINNCLKDIKIAFRWHKPAIISSHRVNYIGALNPANRDKGLKQLKELLMAIVKNWPDTIFLTTSELGKFLKKNPY